LAGKPKRSGPPGNTNASKYGWRVLVRRALIRPKDAWVNRPVDCYVDALREDKPECTGAEAHAIEVAGTAKACSLLILNELQKSGFTCTIDGVVELTPAARELPRFLSVELSALKLLGMERRLRPAITLHDYLNGKAPAPHVAKDPQPAPTTHEASAASAPTTHLSPSQED